MIRNRFIATVFLALGSSAAAVISAEPPPTPEPVPAKQPEQPPGHIIKVEIGFEPGPLEETIVTTSASTVEPPIAAPTPEPTLPPPTPSPENVPPQAAAVIPANAPPPASVALPPVTPLPEMSKANALALGTLERMALTFALAKTQSLTATGRPVTFASAAGDKAIDSPNGFVDQLVPTITGAKGKPAAPTTTAQSQMLAQEYRLINNVRLRYYHLLALQKLITVREDLANVSRDAVTAIEAMTNAGQATKAELLQAKIEAREQMAALESVRAIRQAVWKRMAIAVGQPELLVCPLAGDIEQGAALPGFDAAWAHVIESNPDLQLVRGEVARRQATLRQSLSGSTGKSGDGDKSAPDGFIGQAVAFFNSPLPAHSPQVKQAAWSDLSRWEAEIGRTEQVLKQRLTDAYSHYDRSKQVAELYRAQNLPDAKEAFELSVISYRQGRGSWPQVQIAQRNYFRISTEYVESLAELRRTELTILGLVIDAPDEAPAQTSQK